MPVTISPTRSAYSSYMIERSASWIRWRSTCLAVCPAMRLKPSGVTSTIWAGWNQSHSISGSGSSSAGWSPSAPRGAAANRRPGPPLGGLLALGALRGGVKRLLGLLLGLDGAMVRVHLEVRVPRVGGDRPD